MGIPREMAFVVYQQPSAFLVPLFVEVLKTAENSCPTRTNSAPVNEIW